MNSKDLLLKNRSYRRFAQEPALSEDDLRDLIDAARLSPSSRNDQPLKFIIVKSKEACKDIFLHTAWAGYLKDWHGPDESERPTSYIIILTDTEISGKSEIDVGIMAQSMLLTATEKGYGGCMLASIDRFKIRELFSIDDKYDVPLVLALGKPAEIVVIEDIESDNTHYYRDANSVHHVPKRTLEELIIDIR